MQTDAFLFSFQFFFEKSNKQPSPMRVMSERGREDKPITSVLYSKRGGGELYGAIFNRPGFQEMMKQVEDYGVSRSLSRTCPGWAGSIPTWAVYRTDLPRLRRALYCHQRRCGQRQRGKRLRGVQKRVQRLLPKDTSKKIRAVVKLRGEDREHIASNPPCGYVEDPQDKKKWVVDEEAAQVVRRIFNLCVAGKGPMQIVCYD